MLAFHAKVVFIIFNSDGMHYTCSSGMCIVTAYICDGYADCYDKSDELACNVSLTSQNETESMNTSHCVGLYYMCPSGECIPIDRRCDHRYDCQDGSDEVCCPTITNQLYQLLDHVSGTDFLLNSERLVHWTH